MEEVTEEKNTVVSGKIVKTKQINVCVLHRKNAYKDFL